MAAQNIIQSFRSFVSWITQSSNDSNVDTTPGSCWLFDLPPEILQTITQHLNIRDLISLSRTCRTLYTLINDDHFWIHLIRCRYPPAIAQHYTIDLFQQPENNEIVVVHDEIRPSGFQNIRTDGEIDFAAINSATHYNDEAVQRRRAKMHVTKENFRDSIQYYQFDTPENRSAIPLMKLIYFYLADRKRCATVNMSVIHRNDRYLVEEDDVDSLTGRVIRLHSVCWLEIAGRFEHIIMPGKYEVSWRMKCIQGARIWGETEFSVVPQHGRLLIHRINEEEFRALALEHDNSWFTQRMGQIIIYEPSNVLVAIRNWLNGNWKSGITWDYIELTATP